MQVDKFVLRCWFLPKHRNCRASGEINFTDNDKRCVNLDRAKTGGRQCAESHGFYAPSNDPTLGCGARRDDASTRSLIAAPTDAAVAMRTQAAARPRAAPDRDLPRGGGAALRRRDPATVAITFNGEIFNQVELRAELRRQRNPLPHAFRTGVPAAPLASSGARPASRPLNGDSPRHPRPASQPALRRARRVGVRPLSAERARALYFGSRGEGASRRAGDRGRGDPLGLRRQLRPVVPLPPARLRRGERACRRAPC